jgi:hypothetical protein
VFPLLFRISILGLTNKKLSAPESKLKAPIPTNKPKPIKIAKIIAIYVVLTLTPENELNNQLLTISF